MSTQGNPNLLTSGIHGLRFGRTNLYLPVQTTGNRRGPIPNYWTRNSRSNSQSRLKPFPTLLGLASTEPTFTVGGERLVPELELVLGLDSILRTRRDILALVPRTPGPDGSPHLLSYIHFPNRVLSAMYLCLTGHGEWGHREWGHGEWGHRDWTEPWVL